jgi:hypothetical protein
VTRTTIRIRFVLALLTACLCGNRAAYAADLRSLAEIADADGDRLVAIVTADIDADGDLDVVASDTDLQIHVWVNDGAGHLTPRSPMRTTTWGAVPPLPSVDARRTTRESCTPSSPPSFDGRYRVIDGTPNAASRVTSAATRVSAATNAFTRTPRAPPATILL